MYFGNNGPLSVLHLDDTGGSGSGRWKFGVGFGDGYGVDVVPSLGLTSGNVYTLGRRARCSGSADR